MSNTVATGWPSGSGNLGWGQEPTAMLMPGRVQGWPAGTQRAANRAETLLTQAVAYWDVAQYRDGDRFLRNRGTGGELLDLRLGSSIIANSNDPLFLPVSDDGYVYLSGVAGNSLTVTAPATATNYIAYPLDRSVANTTGAVTGGATFTFSTTGSWRLIELLDASNVVQDTIDCDVITSGSATSFASGVLNQTVTINRSASGRKSVAVPSRSKGGSPVFLFGTDDSMVCTDNRQKLIFNFQQSESFTFLMVMRQFGTATIDGAASYFSKTNDGANFPTGGAGWYFYRSNNSSTPVAEIYSYRNNVFLSVSNPAITSGALSMLTGVVNRSSQLLSAFTNAVAASSTSNIRTVGHIDPAEVLYVGRRGDSRPYYADMEFYAAAIFRRALTANEITLLSNYFTGRIA